MPPALIGVDWGTSNFRAFLLDARGAVLDRRDGPHGILKVKDGDFAGVLRKEIGAWIAREKLPVLMSGMIGSRQGWLEGPYVTAPAAIADLGAALMSVSFEGAETRIIAGIESAAGGMRDLMRGEETQVFGALALLGRDEGRFVLPGTHSKWVGVENGRITSIATYMTGEIYAAARARTILGRLMADGRGNAAIFARGVKEGAAPGGPGALLNRLFGVRTTGLFGEIAAADLPDYLSGLLIGAEMSEAGRLESRPVSIIASGNLAARYSAAAAELGIAAEVLPSDCVALGYVAIARAGGLLHDA